MNQPAVSVVIPAYNQADFLGEAIQSVLEQTFPNFEVIIVNDASPDHTGEVVKQFSDPRIQYIVHEENLGLPAARNAGIRASSGELIALLDADDLYHREKLQEHTKFLADNHDVGIAYNARFDLNHSADTIRQLWRPPVTLSLSDLVLGFPFSPSDTVLRRKWLFRVGLFDETLINGGEDSDLPCRLALAGCHFASVDKALNYRRYHSGRSRPNLKMRLDEYVDVLNKTFSDPRCPADVSSLKPLAYSSRLLEVAWYALTQNETSLGRECVNEIVRLDPGSIGGQPCKLVESLLIYSVADDNRDHEKLLDSILNQMPTNLSYLQKQYKWAVTRGYLLKGGRAVMWGRIEEGQVYFNNANEKSAEIDDSYLRMLAAQLISYEQEFGSKAAQQALLQLSPFIETIGGHSSIRWLKGCYSINRGFRRFEAGERGGVPRIVLSAIANNPTYLTDRGVMSMLVRSIANR